MTLQSTLAGRHSWALVLTLVVIVPMVAMGTVALWDLRKWLGLGWGNLLLFTVAAVIYTIPFFGVYMLLRAASNTGKEPLVVPSSRASVISGVVMGAEAGLFAGWVFVFTMVLQSIESAMVFVMPTLAAPLVYLPAITGAALGALVMYALTRRHKQPVARLEAHGRTSGSPSRK